MGIHRSPVASPRKGQWRRTLMFSLICAWINGWANNWDAGDLRRLCAYYDGTVVCYFIFPKYFIITIGIDKWQGFQSRNHHKNSVLMYVKTVRYMPRDAMWRYIFWSTLVLVMLHAKPLPNPVLTYCQLGPSEQTSGDLNEIQTFSFGNLNPFVRAHVLMCTGKMLQQIAKMFMPLYPYHEYCASSYGDMSGIDPYVSNSIYKGVCSLYSGNVSMI